MIYQKFFGPHGDEWGVVNVERLWVISGQEMAFGVSARKQRMGTRFGDQRKRTSYILAVKFAVWSLDLRYLHKTGER